MQSSLRISRAWKRVLAVVSAAALGVGLVACTSGTSSDDDGGVDVGADEPRVLRIGTSTPPTSLDPARSATFGITFLSPVYESLIRRDPEGLLQPGLATEWELSADATQLSLTLREGVTFQDEAPFDAEVVKANLDAAPERGGLIASQLAILTDVEVVDESHVLLTMNRPAADMLGVLASEAGMMISPQALGSGDLDTNPVGTGPFTVTQWNQTGVIYEAWDGYWNADRIKLDRIEYLTGLNEDQSRLNAVLTGEVNLGAAMRYAQIEEMQERAPDTVTYAAQGLASVVGLMVNAAEGEWANPAMRLAALHAIDREAISEALYGGSEGCEPVAQPYPTSYWASDPALETSEVAAFAPDLARQLLEDAGLIGVKVKLYVGAATLYQNMAAAVQEQLNAVGMDVTVESLDSATLSDLRGRGEFEASIASAQSSRPDPAQFVQSFYTPDGAFNYGHLEYEGIDEALMGLNSTDDQDERAEYMHVIMREILEQGPLMIPICAPATVIMYSTELAGVEIPISQDYDWTYVYYKDDE